jgi:hypothetical protein
MSDDSRRKLTAVLAEAQRTYGVLFAEFLGCFRGLAGVKLTVEDQRMMEQIGEKFRKMTEAEEATEKVVEDKGRGDEMVDRTLAALERLNDELININRDIRAVIERSKGD